MNEWTGEGKRGPPGGGGGGTKGQGRATSFGAPCGLVGCELQIHIHATLQEILENCLSVFHDLVVGGVDHDELKKRAAPCTQRHVRKRCVRHGPVVVVEIFVDIHADGKWTWEGRAE